MSGLFDELVRRPQCLPPLCGALIQAALALYLTLKTGELEVRAWFAVVAFCSSLWSITTAITLGLEPGQLELGHRCAQVAFASIALAGPCSLRFAAALARVRLRLANASVGLGVAVAAVLLLFPSLTRVALRPTGGYWPVLTPGALIAAMVAIPTICYGIELTRRAFVALPPSRRRRQVGWTAAALGFGALGGVDAHTLLIDSYPIGWATGSLACLVLFYAIVQHRSMAIRTFLRQTILGLLGAVVAALFIYGVAVAGGSAASSPVWMGTAAFTLFVITRVWVAGVEPSLGQLLGWRRRRIERAIAEFERRSLDARATADVQAHLADGLRTGFEAELTVLVTPDRDRTDEPACVVLAESAMASIAAPVLRDHMDLGDPGAATLLAALDHLRADALVPLIREGNLIGMAAVAGRSLSRADDALTGDLQRLGERAARAWVNGRLYQEVERRGLGLEAQVRVRTAELENALTDLKVAQAKLVDAERSSSLGLLVAGVSHEINNALNFISANLPTLGRYASACEQLIDRAPAVPRSTRVSEAISAVPQIIASVAEATRRTGGIIGDLRKFARPDAERRLFRIEEGLDAALNLLRRRTDGRIDVARVYAGSPSVECYPGPLNQCFFNVLLNAVEAARSEIWVILRERADRTGVEVLVSDDGEGIPAENLDAIFQPFFTTKKKAAGLGLTVAKSVVTRHGGRIEVHSAPGDGAAVSVQLPMRAPETAP